LLILVPTTVLGGVLKLSVCVLCRNEVDSIGQTLHDLAHQSFFEEFEVLVADGLSDDGSRELLAEFSTTDLPYRLRVLDNTAITIASGSNLMVSEASGEYIIMLGGHCRLPSDYLESIMSVLRKPGHDIVGPVTRYIPGGKTTVASDIALALNTRVGNGGTPGRQSLREATRVIHAPMHCYRREVWEAVGGYDESLLTNDDFDFDYRAHLQGFSVWSLPHPKYALVARTSIPALVRQRIRYGYWTWQRVKRYPRSLRVRQLLPVTVTAGIMASLVSVLWVPEAVLLPIVYSLFLSTYAARLAIRQDIGARWWRLAFIYAAIHLSWGSGFIWGMATQPIRNIK
jgi:succinoglycan biosynthesis protein ExoA